MDQDADAPHGAAQGDEQMDCRHRHGFRTFFSHLIGTQQAVKLKTSEEKQDGRLQEHDCDRGASGSQGRQRHDRRKHSAGTGHHRDAFAPLS